MVRAAVLVKGRSDRESRLRDALSTFSLAAAIDHRRPTIGRSVVDRSAVDRETIGTLFPGRGGSWSWGGDPYWDASRRPGGGWDLVFRERAHTESYMLEHDRDLVLLWSREVSATPAVSPYRHDALLAPLAELATAAASVRTAVNP